MENQAPKPDFTPETAPITSFRAQLLEQAKETNTSPGVYLMKDSHGLVLYVGKAKHLRNRLISYFQSPVHEDPRIEWLLAKVTHFDVILTETEAEALILEATLIKKHKPKHNVRLKDDKAYPYIKIQLSDPFPRLEWTRRVFRDGARYFGPFPSARGAREIMSLLIETFKIRDCSENTFRHRTRPCILYQMDKCSGPCVGIVDTNTYRQSIDEIVHVLEGKSDSLLKALKKGMEEAAEHEEYEVAAACRDQIRNLELITETQGAVEAESHRNRDVLGIARKETEAHATLLRIRNGKMVAIQHFHLQNVDARQPQSEILFDFISQYYLGIRKRVVKAESALNGPVNNTDGESEVATQVGLLLNEVLATEVLLPETPEDVELLEKTLGIGLRVAESPVDEQLLNVARANATYALEQVQKKPQGHGTEALEEVQKKLHLQKYPHRIECYDISNIQGVDAVASRVVFMDGAPDKSLYRRYKIRSVEGSNDFAMMKEVLGRRFGNREEALPDLVVVDGGRGQLAQAVAIMDEFSIQGIEAVGLAKARTESDFQAKEVKSSMERIFIPNRKNPVPLLPTSGAYKLLTHVRDEAHRFAVTYHRLVRDKRSMGRDGMGRNG